MNIKLSGDHYIISFDYDPDYVEACRELQGSRYNPRQRVWVAPRTVPNALALRKWGFHDKELLERPEQECKFMGHLWELDAKYYEHQKKWSLSAINRKRCILVAKMGLGKTLMAMQWLALHGLPPKDVLVVCPASLIGNWEAEFKKFASLDAIAISGSSRAKRLEEEGLHIVNYEYVTLNADAREWAKSKKVFIFDESHKLKNPTSKRSKTLTELAESADYILEMTGTPVSQGAEDYFSQIRILDKYTLGSTFTGFKHRYCIEEHIRGRDPWVKRIVDYKNLDELTRVIGPLMYSVDPKDCPDLPEKVYIQRHVELSANQRKKYSQLRNEMATWLDSGEEVTAANILTRLIRFSQVTQGFLIGDEGNVQHLDNPKLLALEEILEDLGNEPVVVMCRFREDINQVCRMLAGKGITHGELHGDVKDRLFVVNNFRSGKYRVLVGQIRVAGVGFNMEHCKHMVFYSNEYSLNDRLQAEDRIHRVTSTIEEPCVYLDIKARNTVDEHVITALTNKRNVADMLAELRHHITC